MSQQADTADQFDPIEESAMTLMEHLIELRTRMMWIGGALIIATLVAMIFAWDIVEIINRPLGGYVPQAIGPTDNLVVFFKVSLASGAAIAMPIIMYQLMAFIAPGLYPHERRTLIMMLPGAMILFLVGVVFAFFIMLPPAVNFLMSFGGDQIRTEWTAALYISFVTRIVFWIGVAFQAPLVVAFLARIGLLSGPTLLGFWRQSIVIIAVAAAFITPTIDPVNMTIVMGPLIGLYFVSVGVAYIMYRPREPRDFSDSFIPDEYQDEDDSPVDDPPDDEPPQGDQPVDESPEGDLPDDDSPEDDQPDDDPPQGDPPVDDQPVDDPPDDEPPDDEPPEGDPPEDEPPEGEPPDDDPPEDESPDDEPSDDDQPIDDEPPKDGPPEDEPPDDDQPDDDSPVDEPPQDDQPEDDQPDEDKPDEDKPEQKERDG